MLAEREWSVDELVVACMARSLQGEALVAGVTPCSLLAALVARETHAPDLLVLGSLGAVAAPATLPLVAHSFLAYGEATRRGPFARLDTGDVFDYVSMGKLRIWIAPAQVDRRGQANISAIGPWERPKVALVGARGLPDDAAQLPEMLYYLPRQSPRALVERVDVLCAPAEGIRVRLVTDLAVFERAPGDNALRPVSLHPDTQPAALAAATGWPLALPPDLPRTAPPTPAELAAIRALDPHGLRRLEFTSGEAWRSALLEAAARERAEVVGHAPVQVAHD